MASVHVTGSPDDGKHTSCYHEMSPLPVLWEHSKEYFDADSLDINRCRVIRMLFIEGGVMAQFGGCLKAKEGR